MLFTLQHKREAHPRTPYAQRDFASDFYDMGLNWPAACVFSIEGMINSMHTVALTEGECPMPLEAVAF